jgi:hypothetical protein
VSQRRVVQFSCGASSAVAAKLTVLRHSDVAVVNAFVAEEHEDNRRFLSDVEAWLGVPIVVLREEKHVASAYEVFRRRRYIKGPNGAPCARILKRELLTKWSQPGDVPVIGYTAEESRRAENILDEMPSAEFPLIEEGMTKADCLALIERAGIRLPAMYRMGYNNANCVGCVKGGAGYWNKIRRDFPERFEEMARIEDEIGESAYLMRDRQTGIRIPLRQLDPTSGRHDEPEIACGFVCQRIDDEIEQNQGGGR